MQRGVRTAPPGSTSAPAGSARAAPPAPCSVAARCAAASSGRPSAASASAAYPCAAWRSACDTASACRSCARDLVSGSASAWLSRQRVCGWCVRCGRGSEADSKQGRSTARLQQPARMRERAERVPPLQAQPCARRVRRRLHRARPRLRARRARRARCRTRCRVFGLAWGCVCDRRCPKWQPRAHVRRRATLREVGAARLPARRDA